MAAAATLAGVFDEEKVVVPSGGYIANQIVQAPSGKAGVVQTSYTLTASTDSATIRTSGLVTVPCGSTVVGVKGDRLWWDSANDTAVRYSPAAGWYLGTLAATKADGDTTANVVLNYTPAEKIVTKTADYTILEGDNGTIFTTSGASGTVVFTLPVGKPGLKYGFEVGASQAVRIDPNGSETLSLHTGAVQAAGKYATSSTAGHFFWFECIRSGHWNCVGYAGTLTVEA